jgi:hypothetical protein
VEHVKDGREHLHVAWSRIDGETLCAIPDSHNYRRHEIVARELEREFEHARVQGAHHEREGVERPARRPSHAETRQAERSGISPEDAKAQLRELWQSADNGRAFAAALDEAGWTLAQGDRRGFVALDPAAEVHAVNKAITGLSAAQVRDRLADLDAGLLPSVDQARGQLRAREKQPEPAPAAQPEFVRAAEAEADARARADDAALAAELARMRQEIAQGEAALAELDAIREAVRDQFRQQREALNAAELQAGRDERLARETRQRGDDSALNAAHAMEDLARIDPLGTEHNFGHHAGDRLKSPEEMRRDWADLMRGGVSAEQAAARDKAQAEDLDRDPRTKKHGQDPEPILTTQEPKPKASPRLDRADARSPDPLAERTAWAERLRRFDATPEPVRKPRRARAKQPDLADAKVAGDSPEATQRPSYGADSGRDRPFRAGSASPAPENERGGLFKRLRAFVRGWWDSQPQSAPQPDRAADRRHEAAGDRQTEHVRPPPAPLPKPDRTPPPEQEKARPAERFAKRDFADELLAEARARLAKETPEQRAEREQSRGQGDGSHERDRHHHSRLWELFHPFNDYRRRDHRRHTL